MSCNGSAKGSGSASIFLYFGLTLVIFNSMSVAVSLLWASITAAGATTIKNPSRPAVKEAWSPARPECPNKLIDEAWPKSIPRLCSALRERVASRAAEAKIVLSPSPVPFGFKPNEPVSNFPKASQNKISAGCPPSMFVSCKWSPATTGTTNEPCPLITWRSTPRGNCRSPGRKMRLAAGAMERESCI